MWGYYSSDSEKKFRLSQDSTSKTHVITIPAQVWHVTYARRAGRQTVRLSGTRLLLIMSEVADVRGESGGAHPAVPAARNLGNFRGTGEAVPSVNRTFEWGAVIATFLSVFSIVPV